MAGGRFVPVSNQGQALREFGEDANRFGVKRIDLDSALDEREYEIGGNVLWAVEASDALATINVRFHTQRNDAIPYKRGSMIRGIDFSRIYVSADAQAGKFVTLMYVRETRGNVSVENPGSSFSDVELLKAANAEYDNRTHGDATSIISAADPTKVATIVQADPNNTEGVHVGNDSVAAELRNWPILLPGASITFNGTFEIRGVRVSGATTFPRTRCAIIKD